MTIIEYEAIDFLDPLPGNVMIPKSGSLSVSPARLLWAAATVGYSPYGPSANRRLSPLEIQWRTAMVRAALSSEYGRFRRSNNYRRLDSSEKGALSFFLGQAQAKLFAHDIFRISRFVHYDKYLEHIGSPRSGTRPDFLGFRRDGTAIAVEAKGRSGLWDDKLVESAKKQVNALAGIAGYPNMTRYVHIAHFNRGKWEARLIDPPGSRNLEAADPALLTLAYYEPIVSAVLGNRSEESVKSGDYRYWRANFPDVDAIILIREDIANLTTEALSEQSDEGPSRRSKVSKLYELTLQLDSAESEEPHLSRRDNGEFFLGSDGVGVELGSSWENWT